MNTIKYPIAIFVALFLVATPILATAAPGSLDPAFGHGGFNVFPHTMYSVTDVKIQSNGRIVVSGDAPGVGNAIGGFTLVRFLADGRTDQQFGNAGLTGAQFSPLFNAAE